VSLDLVFKSGETTSTIYPGYAVVLSTTEDQTVVLTTTEASTLVAGIAMQEIAPGSYGRVRVFGLTSATIDGSVTAGDYVGTSATAGHVKTITPSVGNVLGVAFTSGTGTQKIFVNRM